MELLGSYREFRRRQNGLLIWLRLEEWPKDIPLAPRTRVAETGEGPFDPYWRIVLEPDKTIEVVVGWFVVPLGFEETIAWYRTKLVELGWTDGSKDRYEMSDKALLRFQHPETHVQLEASIQWWQYKEETTAMIRRIIEHPWSPPSKGNGAGTRVRAKSAARTPKAKKRRVLHKARQRVVA